MSNIPSICTVILGLGYYLKTGPTNLSGGSNQWLIVKNGLITAWPLLIECRTILYLQTFPNQDEMLHSHQGLLSLLCRIESLFAIMASI